MNRSLNYCLYFAALTGMTALGQTLSSDQVGTPEQPAIEYQLSLDAFSGTKFDSPLSASTLLRNFDIEMNRFQLDAATLSVQLSKGPFGLHFDSGYGKMYSTMNASDPLGGANRYFGQAYATVRPWKSSDFTVDFGKFYTSVGAEVPDTSSNANYSRSLMFTLGSPYYHFGLRTSKSLSKSLVVGAQLVNGWNDVVNNTHGHTVGLTATYTQRIFNITETYLVGPNVMPYTAPAVNNLVSAGLVLNTADVARESQLMDSILKLTPRPNLNGYVEAIYGQENRAIEGHAKWYGVAGAVTLPIKAGWSFSPRWEYYSDASGVTTGVVQQLQELTATLQYQVKRFPVTARAEYRCDISDRPFFEGNVDKSRTQKTALIALLYTWKGSR